VQPGAGPRSTADPPVSAGRHGPRLPGHRPV